MSRRIILLGYPLKHSVSPSFQQAALDFYNLDIHYEAWEREPAQLSSAVEQLRSHDYLGANVTIPYKEAVLSMVDSVDDVASRIRAVNTIVNRAGGLIGCNTDVEGFSEALRREGDFEVRGKRVLILGAGGSARSVAYALVKCEAASIIVANRTLKRAKALLSTIGKTATVEGVKVELVALPWEDRERRNMLEGCQLIVNCTSIGMRFSSEEGHSPLSAASISRDAFVYDLVYNPVDTPLVKMAREAGARTLGGLAMLVYQGARSFELWTGKKAPLQEMFAAARQALA